MKARTLGCSSRLVSLSGFFSLTIVMAVLALLLRASPASAGQLCLQSQFAASGAGQNLGCTANDVRVAKAINIRNPATGAPLSTCFGGTRFSFLADFLVVTSSTSSRSNIGLYMNLQDESALTATDSSCADNILSMPHFCADSSGALCGSNHYDELDPQVDSKGNPVPDNCGDSTSADPTVCLDANNNVVVCPAPAGGSTFTAAQVVTIEINDFLCQAPAGSTTLVLPNCTSWQVPGKTIVCNDTDTTTWPFNPAAIPGSPSKCNCETISLPITPVTYAITTTKTPSPTTLVEPGGNFTYTVGVTNTSDTSLGSFGNIAINQICDNRFGNIATAKMCKGGTNALNSCSTDADCTGGGTCFTPNACAAGSLCSAPNNVAGTTCATKISCSLPSAQIAPAATVSSLCSFTGSYTPGTEGSLTDTVNVSGLGVGGGAASANASATVTVSEGPATVQTSKTLDSSRECATARYKVEVDNTSAANTDESESLTGLTDLNFGSITTVHGSGDGAVLGTTCGVASGSPGLGTLSTVGSGPGTLAATIPPQGSYICEFDGQFCGALNSGCLTHQNTVSATVIDDNSEGNPVTGTTSSTLTVNSCFTSH
jgi:hypothetical protein